MTSSEVAALKQIFQRQLAYVQGGGWNLGDMHNRQLEVALRRYPAGI